MATEKLGILLKEMCVYPKYSVTKEGLFSTCKFKCRLDLDVLGISVAGIGQTEEEAKQNAAQSALISLNVIDNEEIEPSVSQASSNEMSPICGNNSVVELDKICRDHQIPAPQYRELDLRDILGVPDKTVLCCIGKFKEIGIGFTVGVAQERSAFNMKNRLSEIFQEDMDDNLEEQKVPVLLPMTGGVGSVGRDSPMDLSSIARENVNTGHELVEKMVQGRVNDDLDVIVVQSAAYEPRKPELDVVQRCSYTETDLIVERNKVLEAIISVKMNFAELERLSQEKKLVVQNTDKLRKDFEKVKQELSEKNTLLDDLNRNIKEKCVILENCIEDSLKLCAQCENIGSSVYGPDYRLPEFSINEIRESLSIIAEKINLLTVIGLKPSTTLIALSESTPCGVSTELMGKLRKFELPYDNTDPFSLSKSILDRISLPQPTQKIDNVIPSTSIESNLTAKESSEGVKSEKRFKQSDGKSSSDGKKKTNSDPVRSPELTQQQDIQDLGYVWTYDEYKKCLSSTFGKNEVENPCPYLLFGSCKDPECYFQHFSVKK